MYYAEYYRIDLRHFVLLTCTLLVFCTIEYWTDKLFEILFNTVVIFYSKV